MSLEVNFEKGLESVRSTLKLPAAKPISAIYHLTVGAAGFFGGFALCGGYCLVNGAKVGIATFQGNVTELKRLYHSESKSWSWSTGLCCLGLGVRNSARGVKDLILTIPSLLKCTADAFAYAGRKIQAQVVKVNK